PAGHPTGIPLLFWARRDGWISAIRAQTCTAPRPDRPYPAATSFHHANAPPLLRLHRHPCHLCIHARLAWWQRAGPLVSAACRPAGGDPSGPRHPHAETGGERPLRSMADLGGLEEWNDLTMIQVVQSIEQLVEWLTQVLVEREHVPHK